MVFFSSPAIFKATSKLFGSQGCSDDKSWLEFSSISLRFVGFAVQFCFCCKLSFHKEQRSSRFDSVVIFLYQSQCFATHSNQFASFCIDNRLPQITEDVKMWKKHQWHTRLSPRVPLCSYHMLTSSVADLLLNRRTATWNLFVKMTANLMQCLAADRIGNMILSSIISSKITIKSMSVIQT